MGWAVSEALRLSIGTVGTWIVLLALIPLGVLFVTRIPYGVLSRDAAGPLRRGCGARKARRASGRPRPRRRR